MYFLRMLLLYPRNQKRSINYLKLYTKTLYIISKTTKANYVISVSMKKEQVINDVKVILKTVYFLMIVKKVINILKLYLF